MAARARRYGTDLPARRGADLGLPTGYASLPQHGPKAPGYYNLIERVPGLLEYPDPAVASPAKVDRPAQSADSHFFYFFGIRLDRS